MVKTIGKAITSLFGMRKFYCDCGYKSNNPATFMGHIASHPTGPSSVDYETGAIVW